MPNHTVSGLTTQGHTVAVLAYNNHDVTSLCLGRVRASGFGGDLVLVDNGSSPPFDAIASEFSCRLIQNRVNAYVNPVWNYLFRKCSSRYLTLLNNDCLVKDGFLNEVAGLMHDADAAIVSPRCILVEDLRRYTCGFSNETEEPVFDWGAKRIGHLMTIDLQLYRQCDYVIPRHFRIWFGDDWIWGQLRLKGFRCARIENRTCICEVSRTISSSEHFDRIIQRERKKAFRSRRMLVARISAGSLNASALEKWREHYTLRGIARRTTRVLKRKLCPRS